ncbi:DUF3152 domain-containing protein [Streptomyces ardesiacus]|uniref:DUF3152 domain-containing protein n=1 Tax=Streptomyces ardesiacus TaxID=285564 RepID=A0ABW8H4C9_9ACTN
MGRHSRRGPAPRADAAENAATRENRTGGRAPEPAHPANGTARGPYGQRGEQGDPRAREAFRSAPGENPGMRQGFAGPGPGRGGGTGAPFPDGTPAHGFPRPADRTPAQGVPRFPDGTPAHGTPAHGAPGFPGGTPGQGAPGARGGHPEQREPGGGWGEWNGRSGAGYGSGAGARAGAAPASYAPAPGPSAPSGPLPRQRRASREGPRQDYLDAFDTDAFDAEDDVFATRPARRAPGAARPAAPYASVTDWSAADGGAAGRGGGGGGVLDDAEDRSPTGEPATAKGAKGRTFTGIAAAAVTTVLAVVVAGQVADGTDGGGTRSQSATDQARDARGSASRDDARPTPSASAKPLTYEQKMGKTYPLSATLKGSGKFEAVPGIAKGTGKGERYAYRIDVEQGLGLDGELFAEAVQKTLNDDRSWAHNGARTFDRIESGQPDFVITLASPGTTAEWCAKSGLDTTEDNVSCDSAATQRVMINAYRWAQGAEPYGDAIHPYRQMLINHEVGHRIGFNHVTCDKDGELAPVMQQQTKFVDHDGIDCRPNPWAYPNS